MGYTSNERRAERRQECREALSAHIYDRLGLRIPPASVRLQPSKEDGYAWAALSSKNYLLQKTLASCTVGIYQEIMDELGKSLEAVLPQSVLSVDSECGTRVSSHNLSTPTMESGSFITVIEELKEEIRTLTLKLENSQANLQAAICDEERKRFQVKALEGEVKNLGSLIASLKEELRQANACICEAARTLQDYSSLKTRPLTKDEMNVPETLRNLAENET